MKPWQDSLPKALAENPLFRTYKTVDDLAQAHEHLTKLKGAAAAELLKIPSKPQDQDPDAWKPLHKALGVPEKAEDYEIKLAPEAATDGPALETALREFGLKANLQKGQMSAAIEFLNDMGVKAAQAEAAEQAELARVTKETLTKEWGAAAEGNTRAIGKLIRDGLGGQIDEAAMVDLETSLGSNLTLSRVLAYAVSKMAEPEAPGGGNALPETKQLTPVAATAALNAFHGDPDKMAALNSRNHPQHKAVLAERAALLAQQNGEKRPDAVS